MNAPIYVNIDQGIHKGKLKVAQNEKRKKLSGLSFSINIVNFEVFCRTKKLISNLFFLKSVVLFNHPKIQTSGTRIPPLISFSAGNVCSKQIAIFS